MNLLSSETLVILAFILVFLGGIAMTQYIFLGRPLTRNIENVEARLSSKIRIAEIQRATDKKNVDRRIDRIENKFDSIDFRIERVENRIERIESKIDRLTEHLLEKGSSGDI